MHLNQDFIHSKSTNKKYVIEKMGPDGSLILFSFLNGYTVTSPIFIKEMV